MLKTEGYIWFVHVSWTAEFSGKTTTQGCVAVVQNDKRRFAVGCNSRPQSSNRLQWHKVIWLIVPMVLLQQYRLSNSAKYFWGCAEVEQIATQCCGACMHLYQASDVESQSSPEWLSNVVMPRWRSLLLVLHRSVCTGDPASSHNRCALIRSRGPIDLC